jgi:hypothetical protein
MSHRNSRQVDAGEPSGQSRPMSLGFGTLPQKEFGGKLSPIPGSSVGANGLGYDAFTSGFGSRRTPAADEVSEGRSGSAAGADAASIIEDLVQTFYPG